jgi:trehalose/maltose hydrolase-like predicted phosphorylase
MEMKIYEFRWTSQNEKEWVSGRTAIEALKTYLEITDTSIIDLDDEDEIVEVPKEEWSKMTVLNTEYDENDPDDFEEMTFEEWMKQNPGSDIIAGTMYY